MRPSKNGGWSRDSLLRYSCRSPWVSATMIEKVIVVAPTTAVPISTGFPVALKVLPAPSLASTLCFGPGEVQHDPHPERAEVSRDETGEDVQRRATLARASHHLAHVTRLGRGEDLDQLGDDRAGEGAAGDDGGELPPERAVAQMRDERHRD